MKKYATLHSLTEPRRRDVNDTFRRLAELLRESAESATLQFTILTGDERRHWCLELRGSECQVGTEPVERPDLELVTREPTWWEIAEGRLSPLEAFGRGRLRILGDTELGRRLFHRVANSDGAIDICRGNRDGR